MIEQLETIAFTGMLLGAAAIIVSCSAGIAYMIATGIIGDRQRRRDARMRLALKREGREAEL